MTRTLFKFSAIAVIMTILLCSTANRPNSDLIGYLRAAASLIWSEIENELPDDVVDNKAVLELSAAREQLIDRQVAINLSENKLRNLEDEIAKLEKAFEERGSLLASAFTVLRDAIDEKKSSVVFVGTEISLAQFKREIDGLLDLQKRDDETLNTMRQGQQRVAESISEGRAAVRDMKNGLAGIELRFDLLKTRREQAQLESRTLDLVHDVSGHDKSSTALISRSVDRLRNQVEALEVRNAVRSDTANLAQLHESKLQTSYDRLKALKQIALEVELKSLINHAEVASHVE